MTAVLGMALLHSLFRFPVGPAAHAIVLGLVTLAALAPAAALAVVVGLAPFSRQIFLLLHAGHALVRFEEVFILAFLIGWCGRRGFTSTRSPLSREFRWSVALLAVATLASGIVTLMSEAAEHVTTTWAYTAPLITDDYLIGRNALSPTMLFFEGILLAAVGAETCADHPALRRRIVRLMVVSAAAAGLLQVLRIAFAAMTREEAWAAFATLLANARASVLVPDLNAAGSYFAMMLIVAAGAFTSRFAASCAALIAAGLWITGSRTAVAACVIVALSTLIGYSRRHLSRRTRAAGGAIVLLLAAATTWLYPEGRNEALRPAFEFRAVMNRAALSMTVDHPAFGVGLGRFYDRSSAYMPVEYAGVQENAHNNFLQISAELGLLGLGLFAALVVSGLRATWQAGSDSPWERGVAPGLVTFLLTCLAGHPLLVPGAAYPFWLLLGTGAAGGDDRGALRSGTRIAASAILVLIIGATPFRAITAIEQANLEHLGIGLSTWQRDENGMRFRWAGGHSTLFVPSDAPAVHIPLRHGGIDSRVLEVRVFLEDREADRIVLEPGDDWRIFRLRLTGGSQRRFARVELFARPYGQTVPLDVGPTDRSGAVMVGKVEPAGR
jgi:O-antigen ligase